MAHTITLTKRAASLFPSYASGPYPVSLELLAQFAAQNPGLDYGNYCSGWNDIDGRRAYSSESRKITRDLARVREAMHEAYYAGATDSDIDQACISAFSGRIELIRDSDPSAMRVDYCTGQYFPTEYRAAVAAVLEQAARIALARTESLNVAA